jgi:hypothetical protein
MSGQGSPGSTGLPGTRSLQAGIARPLVGVGVRISSREVMIWIPYSCLSDLTLLELVKRPGSGSPVTMVGWFAWCNVRPTGFEPARYLRYGRARRALR